MSNSFSLQRERSSGRNTSNPPNNGEFCMRKYLLTSAAVVAVMAAPSIADSIVSAGATVTGAIALKCTLTLTHNSLALGDISTDTTGKHPGGMTNGSSLFLDGVAMCNGSKNTVEINATPLVTTTPVGTGFTNRIDYTLAVGSLLPGSMSVSTVGAVAATGQTVTQNNVEAFATTGSGATLTTAATTSPIMAGDYSAAVTVTLTAIN
jgi:hypothetical protein